MVMSGKRHRGGRGVKMPLANFTSAGETSVSLRHLTLSCEIKTESPSS
jgi:hypothetical protein